MTTATQRKAALRQANHVRKTRSVIVRQLASLPRERSREACADLLEHPAPEIERMTVARLLGAVNGIAQGGCWKLLRGCGIVEHLEVGRLTDRQRDALAQRLRS